MASDDEDELAQLRSARNARSGIAAGSLQELRLRHQEGSRAESASYFQEAAGPSCRRQVPAAEEDVDKDAAADEAPVIEEEAIDANDLRQQFPLSFGEQEKPAENLEEVHAATVRSSSQAAAARNGHLEVGGASEAAAGPTLPVEEEVEPLVGPVLPSEEADVEEDPYNLPVSHLVALEGHSKAVSCLDVDHTGSRLLSGSRDNSLRIFDFNGMKSTMRSFRSLEPSEGHPMLATSWSPTGDVFLAVSGSAQIKIYDRDGLERGESLRGDMYIRDQRNTKGHISPATGGKWHPIDKRTILLNPTGNTQSFLLCAFRASTAMTCSEDGTLRLWDTATVVQKMVIKPTLQRAARVSVSACAYNADGGSIAAGLVDGSIQIWNAKGSMGRSAAVGAVPVPKAQMMGKQDWRYVAGGAQLLLRGAHPPEIEITSLAFSRDNLTLLSRAADDTLKVWDLRKFKAPLRVFGGLPNLMSTTGACFSPDDRLAITGTSAGRDGTGATLVFVDLAKEAVVRRIGMPGNVVALNWHSRLNQIFVGTGDKTAGAVQVLYSPSLSERGVLFCAHRKPRQKDPFDFEAPLVIHTPHALPLFREERGNKRHLDSKPKGAAERLRPDVGSTRLTGTGSGGRIGATGGTLLTQYVLKNHGKLNDPKEEDIRAKILRHGSAADKSGALFSKAYEKTQPTRIYAEPDEEEEEQK